MHRSVDRFRDDPADVEGRSEGNSDSRPGVPDATGHFDNGDEILLARKLNERHDKERDRCRFELGKASFTRTESHMESDIKSTE